RSLGVRLVTLSNNHVFDHGMEGLADTLDALGEAGISCVGAGRTHEEAREIRYESLRGRLVAFVGMAEREAGCSGPGRGGANPFDTIAAVKAIREARKNARHVVLCLHGGLESTHFPSPEAVRTLRFLAEEGATAVIRHHPHSVQGYEYWKGVPIFYSVGNLLFDWPYALMDAGWYEGILVELRVDERDRCSTVIHPFVQSNGGIGMKRLEDAARDGFLERLEEWSRAIGDDAVLRHRWAEALDARRSSYLSILALPHPILGRIARRLGLIGLVRPGRTNRMILENYFRCDAHREAVLGVLERMPQGIHTKGPDEY
ncbi:MAG TPA: CapA family protein, partial [Thermoanaerobaculia bacterium]|nr:CapA family protein [Thermoanaerobaculia bacterium]